MPDAHRIAKVKLGHLGGDFHADPVVIDTVGVNLQGHPVRLILDGHRAKALGAGYGKFAAGHELGGLPAKRHERRFGKRLYKAVLLERIPEMPSMKDWLLCEKGHWLERG